MPELPDVEHWRRYAARYARGKAVERVEVVDRSVLRNSSPQGLGRSLRGARMPEPQRTGKWLVVPFSPSPVVVHFGMTGELAWSAHADVHPHDRVAFWLDGGRLAYRTQRKLGGVWLARDGVEAVTGPLGPDAIDVSSEQFDELLDGRRGTIKATLMRQDLLAGIGNELSDEILFQARTAPRHAVSDIDTEQRRRLFDAMRQVLRTSLRHGRIPRRSGWITALRGESSAPCPRCRGTVRKGTVGGRTTYWCPSCQN